MKKLTKVAAILAASALLFGGLFLSCSDSDDDDNNNANNNEQTKSDPAVDKEEEADDNGGSGNQTTTPTTYAWTFADLDLTKTTWTAAADSGVDTDASDGAVAKVKPATDFTYASTPTGLDLTIGAGSSSGSFNKISITQSAKGAGSAGSAEPSKTDMITVKVTGPFKVTMIYGANSSSAKTDRTAQIVINGTVAKESEQKIPVDPVSMEYEYKGTDEVTVGFGGSNIVRIHDIKITK